MIQCLFGANPLKKQLRNDTFNVVEICNWENSEQAVAYIHGRLLSIKQFITGHGLKVMFVRIPSMSLVQYAFFHRIPTAAHKFHKFQQDMVEMVTVKVYELITAINAESFLSSISWESDLIKISNKKQGQTWSKC